MKVFHDGGDGITEVSKRHFTRYFKNLTPIELTVRRHGHFTFELYGLAKNKERTPVLILESGFNCGYGGTGPHGTAFALEKLKVPKEIIELMFTKDNLYINFQSDKPKVAFFSMGGGPCVADI